jgi:L-histidine Nalpha-methyltransferase / hercynylcysteine S-oxide synthase
MTIPITANSAAHVGEARQPPSTKILATKGMPKMGSVSNIDIIDIRHDAVEVNLKDEILSSLRPESGIKQLPTLLLYSERGLQLFEEVSFNSWIER